MRTSNVSATNLRSAIMFFPCNVVLYTWEAPLIPTHKKPRFRHAALEVEGAEPRV
jgi:hypothetical protein